MPANAAILGNHRRATDPMLRKHLRSIVHRLIWRERDRVRVMMSAAVTGQRSLVKLLDLLQQQHQLVIVEHDPKRRKRTRGSGEHPAAERRLASQAFQQPRDVLAGEELVRISSGRRRAAVHEGMLHRLDLAEYSGSIEPLLDTEYDNMLACIRCGLCLTSCPTYVLSLNEAEGPRGRVGMARALAEGQLAVTPDLVQHELSCLVCDACSAVCPAGVHMDPLQVGLRSALASKPRASRGRIVASLRGVVFGWLFMGCAVCDASRGGCGCISGAGSAGWRATSAYCVCSDWLDTERLLPAVPELRGPARRDVSVRRGPHPSCRVPSRVLRGVRHVDRVGGRRSRHDTSPPAQWLQRQQSRAQGCCGALHAHGGDLPRALVLARSNIPAFEATEGPIVATPAGCGAMLKDYGHHLRNDPEWAERAATFSRRVRDLSQVLADGVAPPTLRPDQQRVVYQDACHLMHAQRVSRQPRDLLRRFPAWSW